MRKFYYSIIALLLICNLLNAQWQQTNGPVSANIFELAATESAIFAGSRNKIYVSTNKGESWNETNMPHRWTLTTYDNKVYTSSYSELHISADNGQTYTSVPAATDYGHLTCEGTIISLSEDYGMATSTNDGETWTDTEIEAHYMHSLVKFGNRLWAATDNGLFESTDNGFTWEQTGFNDTRIISVIECNNVIYAIKYNGGVTFSTDNGNTWNDLNNGLSTNDVYGLKCLNNQVWVLDRNGNVYRLMESSWESQTYNLPTGLCLTDINIFNNTIFVCADGNGIFSLEDNNWTQCSNGIESRTVIGTIFYNNNKLFASLSSGLHTSTDQGTNWQWSKSTRIYSCFYKHNELIYAGTSEGIYTSDDNGISWDLLNSEKKYVTDILFANNAFYCSNGNGVYKSTNEGLTWIDFNAGFPEDFDINSIAVKDEVIFATSWNHKVFKSSIQNASWIPANNGLNNDLCKSIFATDSIVFVSDWWNGIYKTTDDGSTWTYSGLDGKCIVEFKQWNEYLFAATWDDGIFYTADKGETWIEFNEGIDVPFTDPDNLYQTFETLAIGDKYIYTGGTDTKVWKCLLPGMTDTTTAIKNDKSAKYVHLKAYPNPANNHIIIEDAEYNFGEVEIYNTHGQLIKKVNCTESSIDISMLKPGFYVVNAISGSNCSTAKFIKQ